jgi:hypothetical protein
MVKADAKRNYYADLELSTNAGEEEIKKQFRLLGNANLTSQTIQTNTLQPSYIIPTAIEVTKSSSLTNFKPSSKPTRY